MFVEVGEYNHLKCHSENIVWNNTLTSTNCYSRNVIFSKNGAEQILLDLDLLHLVLPHYHQLDSVLEGLLGELNSVAAERCVDRDVFLQSAVASVCLGEWIKNNRTNEKIFVKWFCICVGNYKAAIFAKIVICDFSSPPSVQRPFLAVQRTQCHRYAAVARTRTLVTPKEILDLN